MATAQLNPRQVAFITEYLVDFNGTQAAIRAGYSPKTASVQSFDLLRKPAIAEALTILSRKQLERANVTTERLIDEYAILGFSDMRNYLRFDEKGEVYLDWTNMPPEATRAIAEITQDVYMEGKGEDSREVKRTRFKLHPKQPSLDSLAERFWPAVKRTEHTGDPLSSNPTYNQLNVVINAAAPASIAAMLEAMKRYGEERVMAAMIAFMESPQFAALEEGKR